MKNVLVGLMFVGLVGCGSSPGDAPASAIVAPAPAAIPVYDVSTAFGSNTVCQVVIAGKSAKKTASSSSSLKLYDGETCSGTLLSTLSEAAVASFTDVDGVQYELSGTNATGLTLRVVKY